MLFYYAHHNLIRLEPWCFCRSNWCTALSCPLWHSCPCFHIQAEERGEEKVKWTPQRAVTGSQCVFVLFCVWFRTKQRVFPASGSEDLASDFTTVIPMNNERISKLSENNHDIKETHQNEARVFTSSSPCPKPQQPQEASAFSPHLLEQNLQFDDVPCSHN